MSNIRAVWTTYRKISLGNNDIYCRSLKASAFNSEPNLLSKVTTERANFVYRYIIVNKRQWL